MRNFALILVGTAALVVMLWLGLRPKAAMPEPVPETTEAAVQPASVEPATNRAARMFSRSTHRRERTTVETSTTTNAMAAWDVKIDEIIGADATEAEIGNRLFELYPSVPIEGKADLALEIAARTGNQDYSKLAGLMTNSVTPAEVAEVLLNDLLDRPDPIRLPLLLDIARSTTHPKAEDARDLLEALLGENYGENWNQWSAKISEWIARHPE
jgi:hypothetical protein